MKNEDKLPSIQTVQENLSIGDSLTYKQLTEALNIPYLAGNSKTRQLMQLERFFSYERENTRYIITDIYDHLEPEERPLRSDSVYQRLINILLLSYLKNTENCSAVYTARQWMCILGMVNNQYINDSYKRDIYHDEIEIRGLAFGEHMEEFNRNARRFNYSVFFDRTYSYFRNVFIRCLDELENNMHALDYRNPCFMIYDKSTDGRTLVKRYTTVGEEEIIHETYAETLADYKCTELYQVMIRDSKFRDGFFSELNKRLSIRLNLAPQARISKEIEIRLNTDYSDDLIETDMTIIQQAIHELNTACHNWSNHNAVTYANNKRNFNGNPAKRNWYSIKTQHDLADYYISLENNKEDA